MSLNDIELYLKKYDVQNPVTIQTTSNIFPSCDIEQVLENSLIIVYENKVYLLNFKHIVFKTKNIIFLFLGGFYASFLNVASSLNSIFIQSEIISNSFKVTSFFCNICLNISFIDLHFFIFSLNFISPIPAPPFFWIVIQSLLK